MEDQFEKLKGKTLTAIEVSDDKEAITFATSEGDLYKLCHIQDCCESVTIEDICGDLEDLIGSPLLVAEEVVSERGDPAPNYPESWTWTFYKLDTAKGGVTIRWLGESNGYYCESVDFVRLENDADQPEEP